MSLLSKLRPNGTASGAPTGYVNRSDRLPISASGTPVRICYGLKEFVSHIDGIENGRLLDLGAVAQSTLNFFIERNFKVFSEDLIRTWQDLLRAEEIRLRNAPPPRPGAQEPANQPDPLSDRLMAACLQYPKESFHAVLAWDIFDFFETDLAGRLISRVYELMAPNAVVLVLFHNNRPQSCHRYRVTDAQTVEMCPGPPSEMLRHFFQNREIQDLFRRFRDSRTFVGRDQLRESLFIK